MHKEYRIQEIRRGHVLAQSLDAVEPETLKIAHATKYIENEIIVVEPPIGDSGSGLRSEVIAARIDPSFVGGATPKLASASDGNEREFADYISFEEGEAFEHTLETFRAGDYDGAAVLFRAFIKKFPYHIDAYHHLGIIETDLGHRARALKYFETGYRIGRLAIGQGFTGRLPWSRLNNRPFLRTAHGYGLALEGLRRHLEAVDVYEQILSLNPNDNQGIRYLLPSLYLKAQSPQKARAVLEKHGADGMNLYTQCLIEILDGHRWEAIRWLCRALSYNLHVPSLALSQAKRTEPDQAESFAMGSTQEAAAYLQHNATWQRKESRAFLKHVLAIEPFASRLERAIELHATLDSDHGLPLGAERTSIVAELDDLFDEKCIPKILAECRDAF